MRLIIKDSTNQNSLLHHLHLFIWFRTWKHLRCTESECNINENKWEMVVKSWETMVRCTNICGFFHFHPASHSHRAGTHSTVVLQRASDTPQFKSSCTQCIHILSVKNDWPHILNLRHTDRKHKNIRVEKKNVKFHLCVPLQRIILHTLRYY